MLQDLDFGCLDNQYHAQEPQDGDVVICVQGKSDVPENIEYIFGKEVTCSQLEKILLS